MSIFKAVVSGLVGACTVTLINETVRQFVKDAPRLDVVGERAIAYPLMKAGIEPPPEETLYWITMSSDIIANSIYYSLIGLGEEQNSLRNGALLGTLAGVGAVMLTEPFGLGEKPVNRTPRTESMTILWYLLGGLAAAGTHRMLSDD